MHGGRVAGAFPGGQTAFSRRPLCLSHVDVENTGHLCGNPSYVQMAETVCEQDFPYIYDEYCFLMQTRGANPSPLPDNNTGLN